MPPFSSNVKLQGNRKTLSTQPAASVTQRERARERERERARERERE